MRLLVPSKFPTRNREFGLGFTGSGRVSHETGGTQKVGLVIPYPEASAGLLTAMSISRHRNPFHDFSTAQRVLGARLSVSPASGALSVNSRR
jgi:hypothetical protein